MALGPFQIAQRRLLTKRDEKMLEELLAEEERNNAMSKNWIAGAIGKPGALHRDLGVPMGKKIPLKAERAAAKGNSVTAKRARLALTLRRMRKG